MNYNFQGYIYHLKRSDECVRKDVLRILLKLLDNIIKYPQDFSYRKIQFTHELITNRLLNKTGVVEALFEAGFCEGKNELILPMHDPLTGIKELYKLLNELPESKQVQEELQTSYKRKSFLQQLNFQFLNLLRFEDQELKNKVKSILPLEELQISAIEKLREIQREMKIKNAQKEEVFYEDLLLSELLSWFKFKFFKWVDSPECESCKGECSFHKVIASCKPQISRIEIHRCKNCGSDNEFVRYTDPEILLSTRKGRCGEWAICFTCICRVVGFDSRLVYSVTDHVWTEVWSTAHSRWIHADPCENAMDQPLMYEKGWGQNLSYVIAFSRDEIQDVTWRYTCNYNEVMKRRTLCSETTLTLFISKLNSSRQNSNGYTNARKKFVNKRSAIELAQMLNAPPGFKKPSDLTEDKSNFGGRTSGSLAWRMSRGEVCIKNFQAKQWIIPKKVSTYTFSFNIENDVYTTKDITNDKVLEVKEKWQDGIELLENIFRKEEHDWQMVYLSRLPDATNGKITWTFVVEDNKCTCIDTVNFQATVATYTSGIIKWELKGHFYSNNQTEETKIIPIVDSENFETKDLKGAIKISVNAELSGGEGDTAWQHAQLFRKSLKEKTNKPSLIIRLDLSHN